MAAMTHHDTKPIAPALPKAAGTDLALMQLELAMEMADASDCPLNEKFAQAAEAAGGDLLFVLPAPDGGGMSALIRVTQDGKDRYLQIRTAEEGMAIAEGEDIDPHLLGLARASVDVLQRIGADPDTRAAAKTS